MAESEKIIKRWDTQADDRVCPICKPLEGATALLDEVFSNGLSGPPAHPNCRCILRHFSQSTLEPRKP